MERDIVKSWIFGSSSSSAVYHTLLYSDGNMSCDCKGWCILRHGQTERSCKHTRMVSHGIADNYAISVKEHKNKNEVVLEDIKNKPFRKLILK